MNEDRMLQWFEYEHLPARLQPVSKIFHQTAHKLCDMAAPSAERTVALRKLLEGKDAAVRSMIG